MWVQRFEAVQQDFAFMPAGRIIAGAGTDRRVTLFNCFVMGEIEDDMASIFEHLKQAALIMQAGGGIGYDFSPLRPKGAIVKGVGAKASGAVLLHDGLGFHVRHDRVRRRSPRRDDGDPSRRSS